MKYLIAGLGNFGIEYSNTRHNIGFILLDALAGSSNISFEDKRYGFVATVKHKSRIGILLKPSTYMNLSGRAVNYWLQKEKIPVERLLVVVDDLALPFGTIRIKQRGGDGGHNGLSNITQVLGTDNYARLRFGIGNGFERGQQVDYVLGGISSEESALLPERKEMVSKAIFTFMTLGIERSMNLFNNR